MKYKLQIQFFGSRGAGSGIGGSLGNGDGGGSPATDVKSLLSQRERKQAEVDGVLEMMRTVSEEYNAITVNEVATGKLGNAVLGQYEQSAFGGSETGIVVLSNSIFDNNKSNEVYDRCVDTRYHPSRGDKSGLEAVASHEFGHMIVHQYADLNNMGGDELAGRIVDKASRELKTSARSMAERISRYATKSNHECIAEAVADVHCNGENAKSESKTVVKWLKSYAK